jgi:membrane-associated phospholipid phosphatase
MHAASPSPPRRSTGSAAELRRIALGATVLAASASKVRSGTVGATEQGIFEAVNGLPDLPAAVLWPQQQFGNLAVGPVIAAIAAARGDRQLAAAAALATGLKLAGERVVKALVVRQRPGATVDGAILRGDVPDRGQSFPSGHATMVTALAVVVSPRLAPRLRSLPWVAAGLVMVARVYSGAHHPLDVVGGAGLGLVVGGTTNLAIGGLYGR